MKLRILFVVANYYENISNKMFKSAVSNISSSKFIIKRIDVPGIFEIPVVISKNINRFDAFVALGCVIKGKTPHFDFISQATINGIMNLSIKSKKPIGNGIITCLNKEQALKRIHKGKEAVKAALIILKKINER